MVVLGLLFPKRRITGALLPIGRHLLAGLDNPHAEPTSVRLFLDAIFRRNFAKRHAPSPGLEPGTYGLTDRRSTN